MIFAMTNDTFGGVNEVISGKLRKKKKKKKTKKKKKKQLGLHLPSG